MAISSKPTIDNVDSVLPARRFFATLRMTFIISLLIANFETIGTIETKGTIAKSASAIVCYK